MGKNLEITRRTEDGEYRRVLKWKEVAQRLRLLVYNDQYLTDAEKAPYQAWAAEQQAARAANDAALNHAKHAITDFCENEGLNEPNFSDLTRVEFAYSTTEDDEHEIQVYANLLRNEIRYEVDGNIVHIDYFQDNHELAAQGIENSAFSDFINTAEAEFEKHHPTTRKVEKSPVTIGSTVYLEDDRPFTVEEIGRENIHLRDESFPLVGRAVSHEEFARLLAANHKNAALSAPEVPSRQAQQEETAEPIVGEVIEEPSPFVEQVMADAERLSAEDEPYHREPITYEAPYLDNLPTAPREKFAANIAAIQKLKEIEQRVANGGSPAFEDRQQRQRILGRAGEHQRHPCGGGTFPAGNGRRIERGGRCPLRKFCRGRCVRPQRHDHPQRNLRSRSYRLGQQRMQLLAEQSCPLCQHHQRQLYEHGCGLLVLLHRRGAVYLLDCHIQLKLLLVFIQKL